MRVPPWEGASITRGASKPLRHVTGAACGLGSGGGPAPRPVVGGRSGAGVAGGGAGSRTFRRLGVLKDHAAMKAREEGGAEGRRVVETAVSRRDFLPAVRRDDAPQERQVDRRVGTAEVDPVDDTAQSSFVD